MIKLKPFLLFILLCAPSDQSAMEIPYDPAANTLAWSLALASMCYDSKEKDAQKFREEVLMSLKKISLLSKLYKKIITGIIQGTSDGASVFNNAFLDQMVARIKFTHSLELQNQLDKKKMLAAAYIGTPAILNILEEELKKKSTSEIKLMLDAELKQTYRKEVECYFPGHNCPIIGEGFVYQQASIADSLTKFPPSTQNFCRNLLIEKLRDKTLGKTSSREHELSELEKSSEKALDEGVQLNLDKGTGNVSIIPRHFDGN
jgi:hypothetical protein